MLRVTLLATLLCSTVCLSQIETVPHPDKPPDQNQAPPRYDQDRQTGESSSRDTQIDVSPPKDDAKDHPFSDTSTDADSSTSGIQEFHPWDPHKAAKDIEVGDFYYKRKNYRAALSRYQDALLWKDNDAEATFRLAQCFEKLDKPADATTQYQQYLKILPHGPYAPDAQKALERLRKTGNTTSSAANAQAPHP